MRAACGLTLTLALTAGCARVDALPAAGTCTTECGSVVPQASEGQCEAIRRLESSALDAYAEHTVWKRTDMCRALSGWFFLVNPEADAHGVWVEPHVPGYPGPLRVLGMTYCGRQLTFLGRYDWEWSAYVHEIGHVFDCRVGPAPLASHGGWTRRGVCASINQASVLQDNCDTYD